MAELSPLVVILLCLLGAAAVVVGGAALYRVINPHEWKDHTRAFPEDQISYMREVREINMTRFEGRQYRPPPKRPDTMTITSTMSPSTMM